MKLKITKPTANKEELNAIKVNKVDMYHELILDFYHIKSRIS